MKDGAHITTIEGIAEPTGHCIHCSRPSSTTTRLKVATVPRVRFCSAAGLIAEGKAKTADEIRDLMSGNICRCGAYPNIVAAIEQAMGAMGSKP